ncbi:MAG: hypothetical protein MJ082_06115, partial [Clostridia bacterium]|nr:hypothetical protein [Clostridia bacterium]
FASFLYRDSESPANKSGASFLSRPGGANENAYVVITCTNEVAGLDIYGPLETVTEPDHFDRLPGCGDPSKIGPGTSAQVFVGINPQITLDDGASFRMDEEVTGIRFTGKVNKENRNDLRNALGKDNVKFGILIVPEDYLTAAEFTHKALKAAYPSVPYAEVFATDWYGSTDTEYLIAGSIVSLNTANYGRNFCARAFVELILPDGTVEYFYSDFNKANNSANLYDLAAEAYAAADSEGKAAIAPYLKPVV